MPDDASSCLDGLEAAQDYVIDEPPRVLRRVEPIVPDSLRGRPAIVTIEAIIGEDGTPRHVCLASGDPAWGAAVMDAVRQWHFKPAARAGKPVAARFMIIMRWP